MSGAEKQACLRNILVVLRDYEFPFIKPTAMFTDRTFFEYTQEFERRAMELAVFGGFSIWNRFIRRHGPTARIGFREEVVRCSMQIIIHDGPVEHEMFGHPGPLIEIDFDLWNPDRGVLPVIFHLIEILWNGVTGAKTNPLRIWKCISKRKRKTAKRR